MSLSPYSPLLKSEALRPGCSVVTELAVLKQVKPTPDSVSELLPTELCGEKTPPGHRRSECARSSAFRCHQRAEGNRSDSSLPPQVCPQEEAQARLEWGFLLVPGLFFAGWWCRKRSRMDVGRWEGGGQEKNSV